MTNHLEATRTLEVLWQRVAAIGALVLLALASVIPPHSPSGLRVIPAGLAFLWAAVALSQPGPGAALALLVFVLIGSTAAGIAWQIAMLAAIAVLALASRRWPSVGTLREPLGRSAPWATFLCAAVTPIALVGWVLLLHPDFGDIASAVPKLDRRVLVLGALSFAIVNACEEEWIWRGIMQSRLTAVFPPHIAVGAQALSFGIAHAHGFPRGLVGVLLAGIWALMLGTLRRYSSGLLAPIAAHIVADATIAAIIIVRIQ